MAGTRDIGAPGGEGSCSDTNGDHPDNNYWMLPGSLRDPGLSTGMDFSCSNKPAISPPNRKMAKVLKEPWFQ